MNSAKHVGYVHGSAIDAIRSNLMFDGDKLYYDKTFYLKDGEKSLRQINVPSKYMDAVKNGKFLTITLDKKSVVVQDPY